MARLCPRRAAVARSSPGKWQCLVRVAACAASIRVARRCVRPLAVAPERRSRSCRVPLLSLCLARQERGTLPHCGTDGCSGMVAERGAAWRLAREGERKGCVLQWDRVGAVRRPQRLGTVRAHQRPPSVLRLRHSQGRGKVPLSDDNVGSKCLHNDKRGNCRRDSWTGPKTSEANPARSGAVGTRPT